MPQITIQFVNLMFILSLPLSSVEGAIPCYNQISSDATDVKQVKNKQVKIFLIKLTIQKKKKKTATQGQVST